MKKFATLSLIVMIIFALPACKKDDTSTPAAANNNNNNNSNSRTGLGLLAPASATSYCVVILDYGDTLIWSNTTGDDYRGYGGVSGSASGDLYYTSHTMRSHSIKNLWTQALFNFQMHENHGYSSPACSYVDSMIQVGPVSQSVNGAYFSLGDSTNVYWVTPLDNTGSSSTQVVSVTNIPSSTSCYSLRTKITFSDLDLDVDPFCAAFHTHVVKGELQMDFNVNQ